MKYPEYRGMTPEQALDEGERLVKRGRGQWLAGFDRLDELRRIILDRSAIESVEGVVKLTGGRGGVSYYSKWAFTYGSDDTKTKR